MPGSLRVTQTKSTISHIARNRATVRALGLHRIGDTVIVPDNPATRGMVRQVRFLVEVKELPESTVRRRRHEAPRSAPRPGFHTERACVSDEASPPGRARPRAEARRARRRAPAARSRPGSRADRRRSIMRIPKLRGFRNRFKIEYEVVNVGRIAELVEAGRLETPPANGGKRGPTTVNQDILRATGLVRSVRKPLKILGGGDVGVPLFVMADAFTKSAVAKIEAAGGSAQVIEVPSEPLAALGVTSPETPSAEPTPAPKGDAGAAPTPRTTRRAKAAEAESEPTQPPAEATPDVEPAAAAETGPEPVSEADAEDTADAGSDPTDGRA